MTSDAETVLVATDLCSLVFVGLGDSNYGSYCKCPHMIDDRLQELGATLFMKPGFADDAEG